MSDHAATTHDAHGHDHAHDHGHDHGHGDAPAHAHKHPPYMKIFYQLAFLTLVELVIPLMFKAKPGIGVGILIAIAVVKILLIIRYFMHLKFDARLLGLIAATPAVLASIMALGLLLDN